MSDLVYISLLLQQQKTNTYFSSSLLKLILCPHSSVFNIYSSGHTYTCILKKLENILSVF